MLEAVASEPSINVPDATPRILDYKFTDVLGRWLHRSVRCKPDELFPAIIQSGATVAGGNTTAELGPMVDEEFKLVPIPQTLQLDRYQNCRSVLCKVQTLADTPHPLDFRQALERIEAELIDKNIVDEVRIGVELEYYVFDRVSYSVQPTNVSASIDMHEGSDARIRTVGLSDHRITSKENFLSLPPSDVFALERAALFDELHRHGVGVENSAHETGPSQQEISLSPATPVRAADMVQLTKYLTQNAYAKAGRTATFMPKPLSRHPGSGLHVNLSASRDGQHLLFTDGELSRIGRRFVDTVRRNIRGLCGITNPTCNSYVRIRTMFNTLNELSCRRNSRRGEMRIPRVIDPSGARIELRFPDSSSNPYLCFAAILMCLREALLADATAESDPPALGPPPGRPNPLQPRSFKGRSRFSLACTLEEAVGALHEDARFLTASDELISEDQFGLYLRNLEHHYFRQRAVPHPADFSECLS